MAATAATRLDTPSHTHRWHAQYPELGTGPIPIEPYISPEYFALERERIFRQVWLNVGREEQIPQAGDYFVKDLAVCNTSILVVRGKDGKVRAFHNMCSHRGNKVVWEEHGSCQVFACKFHGWTYNTQGQLTFVPDEEGFFDLNKNVHGLTPVAADIWQGFIFIHLDPQPKETLPEYLGELGEQLRGYPFAETSATCFSWTTDIRANWKLIKDAFQEAYHVAFLHKRSLPDSFTDETNPFGHALDFKLYPRHRRMSVWANPAYRPQPVEALAQRFGSILIRTDFSLERLPPGVNPTRDPHWAIDLNVIFPNFFCDVQEGTYFTYNFWPLAVDRTRWEIRSYYPRATTAGQRFSREYGKVLFRDIITEDANTLEKTQATLASGAKTHFILQDQELLVRHDYKVHEDHVGFYRERNGEQNKRKNSKGSAAHGYKSS